MIQNASNNQSKLLSVINQLFTYVFDPYTNKKVIRVNPKLNEEILQKAVDKTRSLIVDLYIKCELDYVNGIKIYEAIVESKILETTQKQIDNLKSEANKIVQETKNVSIPVNENLKPIITDNHLPSSYSNLSLPNTSTTYSISYPNNNIKNL